MSHSPPPPVQPNQPPFAWVSHGDVWVPDELDRGKVVQCALSRICGVCGQSLGRPIAFVGTPDEVARNAFHFPPLHVGCAMTLAGRTAATEVVTTSGFEFVRPGTGEPDRNPTFQPNSLLP